MGPAVSADRLNPRRYKGFREHHSYKRRGSHPGRPNAFRRYLLRMRTPHLPWSRYSATPVGGMPVRTTHMRPLLHNGKKP